MKEDKNSHLLFDSLFIFLTKQSNLLTFLLTEKNINNNNNNDTETNNFTVSFMFSSEPHSHDSGWAQI